MSLDVAAAAAAEPAKHPSQLALRRGLCAQWPPFPPSNNNCTACLCHHSASLSDSKRGAWSSGDGHGGHSLGTGASRGKGEREPVYVCMHMCYARGPSRRRGVSPARALRVPICRFAGVKRGPPPPPAAQLDQPPRSAPDSAVAVSRCLLLCAVFIVVPLFYYRTGVCQKTGSSRRSYLLAL